ncbi:MAG: RAD55 family ATPase, partial [Chitinispirillaceae bacterium]
MNTLSTEITRLPTGIKRLDTVLKGGLVEHDTYLFYGPPGTGKTVLCHQICFHLIRTRQMRCVYLNLLTESPREIITHLQPFSFYDKSAVPDSLYYLMAEGQIKSSGVVNLVRLISDTIQHKNADLFVFEGIENALLQAPSEIDFLDMISQIRALTRIHACTILLTIKQQQPNPALTVVDGVIELSDTVMGPRAIKQITVHKTRGSGFLPGKHDVELTSDGLEVHPRTESIPPAARRAVYQRKRMPIGINELDTMMDGGILSGSNLAIMGMPGAGKTTLGLSFLVDGAKRGQEG